MCVGGPETVPVPAASVAEQMSLSSVSLSSVVSTSPTLMLAAAAPSQYPQPVQPAAMHQGPPEGGGGIAPGDGHRLCSRGASSLLAYPVYYLAPAMVQPPPPGSISPIQTPPRESERLLSCAVAPSCAEALPVPPTLLACQYPPPSPAMPERGAPADCQVQPEGRQMRSHSRDAQP